jgi:hypothetical protein
MEERLNQFGLEIAPEKTKILEFGPRARWRAKQTGKKSETFDFLGFTHYCTTSRSGKVRTLATDLNKRGNTKAAVKQIKRSTPRQEIAFCNVLNYIYTNQLKI